MVEQIPNLLVNGLALGAIYALIALGYTMVYGIIELINFAHGEICMVGAYIGFGIVAALGIAGTMAGLPLLGAILLVFAAAMLGCALLGVGIERIAYKPLRRAPRLAPLITAVGMSIFLQNAMMHVAGAGQKTMPSLFPQGNWTILGATLTWKQPFTLAMALALMLALRFFINKTKLGTAMRAVAQDKKAASLMGINVDWIIAATFLIGSALGAAAGVMVGMYYGRVDFMMGYMAGIKAFTAAVLGGIGNIQGAVLGGIMLGVLETLGAGLLVGDQWKNVFAFGILILVLIVRPSGLLGEHVPEKV